MQPTEQTQFEPLPDGAEFELRLARVDLGNTSVATARGSYPEGYQIDAGLTIYEVIRIGAGELSFSDPESVAFFDSFELTR